MSEFCMDELLKRHQPMVRSMAHNLHRRLPSSVDVEDLIQVGMISLWNALQSFDSKEAASQKTWVYLKARGAMLDELRRADHMSKHSRTLYKQVVKVESRMLSQGRRPTLQSIAVEMGMVAESVARVKHLAAMEAQHDGEDDGLEEAAPDVLESVEFRQLVDLLDAQIDRLPQRQQDVLRLRLHHEMTNKEVAAYKGYTHSYASQLYTAALRNLTLAFERAGDSVQQVEVPSEEQVDDDYSSLVSTGFGFSKEKMMALMRGEGRC